MKAIRPASLAKGFFAAFCLLLALVSAASAQTGSSVPVVTVQAAQRIATVTYPGVFTIFRAGNTDATLNVWYDLGGVASNGVDYAMIPLHLVTIPAGATSNTIIITPLTNPPPENAAKTVVLTLTNSLMLNPVNYEIGSPSSAVVYIGATNPLPVGIISPKEGMVFYTPTNIQIVAFLNDVNWLTNVEFFAGTNDLGWGILNVGTRAGFSGLTWTNPPVGNYALTAVASYDDLSWTLTKPPVGYYAITSAPVNITVLQGPPTNLPPVVGIVSPTNGAVFYAPANIPLMAKAADPDGNITNVEFFAGTTDLGQGLPVVLDPLLGGGVSGLVYFFNWLNVPTNSYSVTAVATDNDGLSTTSAPITITVQLPPTNFPPIVRITSPPNGSVFRAPVNIPIYAYAVDRDDSVASVEFFAGNTSLGFGHHVTAVPPPLPPGEVQPPILIVVPTNYWELTWTNPPPGTKIALTAEATDNSGLSTTSNPVLVSILPPLPPPTNRPAIVSIVATDPVAIEGTNCWSWPGLISPAATWSNWFAANAVFRLYTNCGPKDAIITVVRFGDTNSDLAVAYGIGGNATNGMDYVALPGTVTIPAGERRADITIVPLDDGPPDITSTVVLKLIPDTTGTNYLLGFPRAAAAIILDSQSPQATTGIVPGPAFNLAAAGPDGAWFHVESSTDLIHWMSICTNQVVNGSIDFVDPDAATNLVRYYRTVPESGPPQ
jgi:hypothetical protein